MTKKIIGGISKAIISEFGKNYAIYSEEVRQGFKQPCFSIKLINSSYQKGIGGRYKYINSFVIRYFPSKALKNQDINDVSKRLFKCLELIDAGRILRGTDMHSEKGSAINLNGLSSDYENGDGILNFFVNYDFHEVSLEPNELMKNLKTF